MSSRALPPMPVSRRFRRILPIAFLALAACVLVALAEIGPADADNASGPERITYAQKAWGTLYLRAGLVPRSGDADFSGQVSVLTGQGTVIIHAEGDGFEVTYPDQTNLVVLPEGEEVRILFKEKPYYLRRTLGGFVAFLPGDEIRCARKGREVTLQGRLGKVVVHEGASGWSVQSPAGETRYEREGPMEPFRLAGVPMVSHPYLRRGVHFERYGVGAFIDFKLRDMGRALSLLPWEPLFILE